MMNKAQIKEILPHREPFLLLTSVAELNPGQSARGTYVVDARAPWFKGHFPGRPVFPGVLQVEALAQLGGVAILSMPENRSKLALFAGLDKVKFRRQVLPGEVMRLQVEIVRARGNYGVGRGSAQVKGQPVLAAELRFALVAGGGID